MTTWDRLQPKHVVKLYQEAAPALGVTFADKTSDGRMQAFAKLWGPEFLTNFVTTLGETIFIPYQPGVVAPSGRWSLKSQTKIIPHEFRHVQDYRKDKVGFMLDYTLFEARRAIFEANAVAAALALEFKVTGTLPDGPSRPLVEILKYYRCGEDAIDHAALVVDSLRVTIRQGGYRNDGVDFVYGFLQREGLLT